MVVAALFTLVLDTAREAFQVLLSVGAGTGLLYLLRWFWWRINAWSEIAAMVSSFVVATGFAFAGGPEHAVPAHLALLASVAVTTVVWVVTTLLTAPTEPAVLAAFYSRIRPAGPGWAPIRAATGLAPSADSLPQAFLGWVLGIAFIYAALFGTGTLLYGRLTQALVWLVVFVVSGAGLARVVPRLWKGSADE
jgi:hypothetical protein